MSLIIKPLNIQSLTLGLKIGIMAEGATKAKWTSILIGAKVNQYIALEMPRIAGAPVKLDEGTNWQINFISNGKLYLFQADIITHTFRPSAITFITYPDDVEIITLRKSKRYPVNIPVLFTYTDEESKETVNGKGLVVDISENGCMMGTKTPIIKNMELNISFYIEGMQPIENIKAEVKTVRESQDTFYSGLYFLSSASKSNSKKIEQIIEKIKNTPLRL